MIETLLIFVNRCRYTTLESSFSHRVSLYFVQHKIYLINGCI